MKSQMEFSATPVVSLYILIFQKTAARWLKRAIKWTLKGKYESGADDGKEFDDEFECSHYEWLLNHPNLKDVKCYDKDGNVFEDIMAEHTYNYCQKIVVPTDQCAKELDDLAIYTGYCYYSHITQAGTWMFEEKGMDGRFVRVGD